MKITSFHLISIDVHRFPMVSGPRSYDAALVATGAKCRPLPINGFDLPQVLLLRTPEDAQRIAGACGPGRRVAVLGSSFIGMELAGTLRRRGCHVTVLGMEQVPFERVLGERLGAALKAFFEAKDVKFMGGKAALEIRKSGSELQAVLKSGETVACDAVVVGVGVIPNAKFVQGAHKAADGSLLTDEYLTLDLEASKNTSMSSRHVTSHTHVIRLYCHTSVKV